MIPSGYSRTVLEGHLNNGEIFQTGFWCDEAPSDEAATQAQATAVAEDFGLATGSVLPWSLLDAASGYDRVVVYSYLDDTGHATFVAEAPAVHAGSGGTAGLPNQVALSCSLLTGFSGRRNRGRMYLPVTVSALVNGQLAPSRAQGVADFMASFLTAVNGDLGDQHVVVLSQVAGTSHPVNAVHVDTRFDVQRRRADREVILGSGQTAVTHP